MCIYIRCVHFSGIEIVISENWTVQQNLTGVRLDYSLCMYVCIYVHE